MIINKVKSIMKKEESLVSFIIGFENFYSMLFYIVFWSAFFLTAYCIFTNVS